MENASEENIDNFAMPKWMDGCPISYDWVKYRGEVFFAVLNWEESDKRGKPVFDLAYCATKAMNGIFLKQRVYRKSTMQLHSNLNQPHSPN